MTMSDQNDAFLRQAESLPTLLSESAGRILDGLRLALATESIFGLREVVFTGSGDSFFAAEAAAQALRHLCRLPAIALPAMEAARYLDTGHLRHMARPRGLLVVAISSSGEAARVVEATQRLRQAGALTLGLTATPESRLGQAAEAVADIAIPAFDPAPGTRSYVASLIGGYGIALRIAELLMSIPMDAANALRAELAGLAGPVETAVASARAAAPDFPDWREMRSVDCLGSGPSLVSARYQAAKLVEAAGLFASAQCCEEFHHLNYFAADPARTAAIVFAPAAAPAASRQRELVDTLDQLGRPQLILTDDPALTGRPGAIALPPAPELFAPILHCGPAAVIATEAARVRGAVHFRGHDGPWRRAQGAGLVRNSRIVMLGEVV
jgi:glutamine---fructose-6-phosphate transaminase (isomerizing)